MGLAWHPVWAYLGIRVSCNGYNIVLREKCGCWVLESVFKECSTLQNLPTGIIKTTLWLKGITGNKRKGNVCLQDPSRSRLGLVYSYTQVYLFVWALKKKNSIGPVTFQFLLFSPMAQVLLKRPRAVPGKYWQALGMNGYKTTKTMQSRVGP